MQVQSQASVMMLCYYKRHVTIALPPSPSYPQDLHGYRLIDEKTTTSLERSELGEGGGNLTYKPRCASAAGPELVLY